MLVNDLGKFVADLTFADLSEAAVETAKSRILDTLGAAMASVQLELHAHLAPLLSGSAEASVWGMRRRLPLREAVLLNSFLAHATYLDDGDRYSGAHPGCVVVPGALALAEAHRLSGKEIIAAVVAGYEVLLWVGQAIYPSTVVRGFQSTAVLGAVGAAAASANLLQLGAKSKDALAIACNLGVGLKEALKASKSQPIQVARACEGGVLAALMAKHGAEGADSILENGFVKAFSDNPKAIGELTIPKAPSRLFDTYIKVHGGCRGTHAPVDAVLEATKEAAVSSDQIEHMTVWVDSVTFAGEIHHPVNGEQAQFNTPFAVAVALLTGNASPFQFTDERLGDAGVRALMQQVRVEVDRELDKGYPDKRGAVVEITLKSGQRLSKRLENAKGEPEHPLTRAELESKFIDLSERVLGANASRLRDAVMGLEAIDDASALARWIQPA